MKKAGASNADKNYVKTLWEKGHDVDQISALSHLQTKHVEAIVARLETSGDAGYVGAQMSLEPEEASEDG